MNCTYPDRSLTASLDDLKGHDVSPDDLEPGDVLAFRGSDDLSRVVQIFDDCFFDHVSLVVPAPPGRDDDEGPWITDVGPRSQKIRRLVDYGDPAEAVLVRRHRNPNWRCPVTERALQLMQGIDGYDFDRLLLVILISLTKFTPRLTQLDRDGDGRVVARFLATVQGILNLVHDRLDLPMSGNARLCVTHLAESFDVGDHAPLKPTDAYYGLAIPNVASTGLLAWVASGEEFLALLDRNRPRSEHDPFDFDPDDALVRLYAGYGFSLSSRGPVSRSDTTAEIEPKLRMATLQAADLALRLLGWRPTGSYVAPSPRSLQACAAYLLDQLLKQRFVVCQSDIVQSRSLFDVGLLRLEAVPWTRRRPLVAAHA